MTVTNDIHPKHSGGRVSILTLPYEDYRATLDCGHPSLYVIQAEKDGPLLCGLCFFKEGYEAELPTRLHLFKTLADNGNPESTPKFVSHLNVVMGLIAPKKDQDLNQFRRHRNSLAREQYTVRSPLDHRLVPLSKQARFTSPSWRLFPVASSLWKLMGYQPPLGVVLVRAIGGRTEQQIATELEVSLMNVHIRMAKAVRTALGYLPKGELS